MRIALSALFCFLAALPARADDAALDAALATLAGDGATSQRIVAIRALGQLGGEAAVAALARTLSDEEDVKLRHAAARALQTLGDEARPAEDALRRALDDSDAGVVVRAAETLAALGVSAESLAAARQRVLFSAGGLEQFFAARGLIGIAPNEELATVIVSFTVRRGKRAARNEFAGSGGDRVQLGMAERALVQLARTGDRDLVEVLRAGLGASAASDMVLLEAMSQFSPAPEDWIALLVDRVAAPGPLASKAMTLLQQRANTPAVVARWSAEIAARCNLTDPGVEIIMAETLGRGGAAAAVAIECLDLMATRATASVRAAAVRAMGAIGDGGQQAVAPEELERLADRLAGLLRRIAEADPEPDVREAATDAYGRLRLPPADIGTFLVDYAGVETDPALRTAAIDRALALGPAGGDHRPALAMLAAAGVDRARLDRLAEFGAAAPVVELTGEAAARARLRRAGYRVHDSDLALALNRADVDAVRAFLDSGFSADHRMSQGYDMPLLVAALSSQRCAEAPAFARDVVALLLERGVDVNQVDSRGVDPLIASIRACDADLVARLVAAGSDLSHRNNLGEDAFEIGLATLAPGIEALLAGGYVLGPARAAQLRERYELDPERIALINRAAGAGD